MKSRIPPSVADEVEDGRFLTKFALLLFENPSHRIIVQTRVEVAELVELEPIHNTIGITVFVARQIVGHDLAGRGEVHIDLAGGGSVGGGLADSVDRIIREW